MYSNFRDTELSDKLTQYKSIKSFKTRCNLDAENSTNVSDDLAINKFNNSDKEVMFS